MENNFLADSISAIVAKERAERMKTSDQLTLGELILRLEAYLPRQGEIAKKYGHEATIRFDFEYAVPTGLGSWRGSYAELAINFDFIGYEHFGKDEPKQKTLKEFIQQLKEAIGKTYTGWKGGEFTMGKTTPIWVANDGNSGETAVVDVFDNEYEIILVTGRREY